MDPEAEHFIDLATRPLAANSELRLAAEGELRKSIAAHPDESLAAATAALERADRHPHRRYRMLALVMVTMLVSLPLLAHCLIQFMEIRKSRDFVRSDLIERKRFPDLTVQQSLLLFGAENATDEAEKWRPLWESEPENPAYLAQYAAGYFQVHKEISPEILAAAQRVDPDNGWFLSLAAAQAADGAVSKDRSGRRPPKAAPVWKIDDEKRFQDALAAIHELVNKPRFDSYRKQLLAEREPLLPPRRDIASQRSVVIYHTSQTEPAFYMRKFMDVLSAGAQQAAAAGDVDAFRRIIEDWRNLSEIMLGENVTLVDGLMARVVVAGALKEFRDGARTLGFEQEADDFEKLDEAFQQERDERDKRGKWKEIDALVTRRGSILNGEVVPLLARQVSSPPPVTEEDLKPGRYAEHALMERAMTWPAWLLLGIFSAGAALSGFARNALAWKLGGRMRDLVRASDWVWIILGGVVFPVLWYLAITRLTPWSAREWSPMLTHFNQPVGQFGCLLLSMVIMPVLIASQRLSIRGAPLGLAPRFPWLGWIAAAAALAGVPAFGAMVDWGRDPAFVLSGIAVAWVLAGLFLGFCGRESQALRRATLARVLPGAWLAGMLALVALVPVYHAQEQYWIRRDRIFGTADNAPASLNYENKVAAALTEELTEVLENFPRRSGE